MALKYDEFYILKFDIKKYFYHIDHQILLHKLEKIYEDKHIIQLLKTIIDSTNYSYINKEITKSIHQEKKKHIEIAQAEELDRIPFYDYQKGLAIGNVTSQILAVFYLSSLDHYIKEQLGCKYYIRYMDDGIIISHDKEYLREIWKKIEIELTSLKLELNKKTNIYKISHGFSFIGYRFFLKDKKIIIRISNHVKKRIHRKINYLNKTDLEKLQRVKASYYGYLKIANANQLQVLYKII